MELGSPEVHSRKQGMAGGDKGRGMRVNWMKQCSLAPGNFEIILESLQASVLYDLTTSLGTR